MRPRAAGDRGGGCQTGDGTGRRGCSSRSTTTRTPARHPPRHLGGRFRRSMGPISPAALRADGLARKTATGAGSPLLTNADIPAAGDSGARSPARDPPRVRWRAWDRTDRLGFRRLAARVQLRTEDTADDAGGVLAEHPRPGANLMGPRAGGVLFADPPLTAVARHQGTPQ